MERDDGTGLRLAFSSPVFMSYFYGPPTKERLDFLFEHERQCVGALPGFCAISVVDIRVGKEMSADARARAKEITEYWGDKGLCSVTVVEGSGFFPALVRSVIAGIQLLSKRGGMKLHVASSIADAVVLVEAAAKAGGLVIDVKDVVATAERLMNPNRVQQRSA